MRRHAQATRRPAAAVFAALLAALAFLLPSSSTAHGEQPGSGRQTVAAPSLTRGESAAHLAPAVARLAFQAAGARPDSAPPPPFLALGASGSAPHRALGGPSVPVRTTGQATRVDVAVPRPRGPPVSRWSTQVPVDV
ncbi:hypothetical protein [Streptomyces sp. NPDC059009]|uniref:hypothetical protein n=1 Tax=Streptomyces sp. NPDC059009 TaxID=3346694 RepID=UPI0036B3839F